MFFRYYLACEVQGRLQIVGRIKRSLRSRVTLGYLVYNHTRNCLYCLTPEDFTDLAYNEQRKENFVNFNVDYKSIHILDGVTSKLPVYDIYFRPLTNNLPVILNSIMYNGAVVGYTILNNGIYNRFNTEDLLKTYTEFYNATEGKPITAKGVPFQTINLADLNKVPEFNTTIISSLRYAKAIGHPVTITTYGSAELAKWARENGFQTN